MSSLSLSHHAERTMNGSKGYRVSVCVCPVVSSLVWSRNCWRPTHTESHFVPPPPPRPPRCRGAGQIGDEFTKRTCFRKNYTQRCWFSVTRLCCCNTCIKKGKKSPFSIVRSGLALTRATGNGSSSLSRGNYERHALKMSNVSTWCHSEKNLAYKLNKYAVQKLHKT